MMKIKLSGIAAVILIFSLLVFSACSRNENHGTDLKKTDTQTEASTETEVTVQTEASTETEVTVQTEAPAETEMAPSHKTDTIGGTETMEENTTKIICNCCGNVISSSQKYCPECGALLDRSSSYAAPGANTAETDTEKKPSVQQERNAEPVNIYPDDSGLKLMVDCCNKTGPLAGGIIRSNEIVLYYDEQTGGYQVHTYASNGYGSGKHEGYYTTKEHASRVMQSIDADTVLKFKDMPTPVGGSQILKFRNENDEMIRAVCGVRELSSMKSTVEGLLYEAVKLENRIVPQEAKNWKSCSVSSNGMIMDSCFNYELERMENGKVKVRGKCFVSGNAHEHENWVELSEKETDKLEKIPLGLMLSDVVTVPNPMMPVMVAEPILDGDSVSVSITYADGRSDTKIPDAEMIQALDELMKQVF